MNFVLIFDDAIPHLVVYPELVLLDGQLMFVDLICQKVVEASMALFGH